MMSYHLLERRENFEETIEKTNAGHDIYRHVRRCQYVFGYHA